MELKKNPKISESKFRTMFRNVGFVIAISLTITAFEWKFEEVEICVFPTDLEDDITIVMEIPKTEQQVARRPKPVITQSTDFIDVLDDFEINIPVDFLKKENVISDDDLLNAFNEGAEDDEAIETPVFNRKTQKAEPERGLKHFHEFLTRYVKRNNHNYTNGQLVKVSFTVNKDGKVSEVKVLNGISKSFDALVVKGIVRYGDWKPAYQNGRRVKQRMKQNIKFVI